MTQLKLISKDEAHKLIENAPGSTVLVLQYNGTLGISDCGKHIRKKKCKKYVDQSSVVVLSQDDPDPVIKLNLHKIYFSNLSTYNIIYRTDNIKSILLPKLE